MFRQIVVNAFVFGLVTAPSLGFAAGLVPCGGPSETPCQMCDLVTMVDTIFDWLVGILSVVFALIIITAGFKLVTSAGNVSAKQSAKKLIWNGIVGFLIVLAAWILVDLLAKTLLGGPDVTIGANNYGPWNSLSCVPQPPVAP